MNHALASLEAPDKSINWGPPTTKPFGLQGGNHNKRYIWGSHHPIKEHVAAHRSVGFALRCAGSVVSGILVVLWQKNVEAVESVKFECLLVAALWDGNNKEIKRKLI